MSVIVFRDSSGEWHRANAEGNASCTFSDRIVLNTDDGVLADDPSVEPDLCRRCVPDPSRGASPLADAIAGALWEAVDDKGIKGRLYREDCDYLADVAAQVAERVVREQAAAQLEAAQYTANDVDGLVDVGYSSEELATRDESLREAARIIRPLEES